MQFVIIKCPFIECSLHSPRGSSSDPLISEREVYDVLECWAKGVDLFSANYVGSMLNHGLKHTNSSVLPFDICDNLDHYLCLMTCSQMWTFFLAAVSKTLLNVGCIKLCIKHMMLGILRLMPVSPWLVRCYFFGVQCKMKFILASYKSLLF